MARSFDHLDEVDAQFEALAAAPDARAREVLLGGIFRALEWAMADVTSRMQRVREEVRRGA